MPIKTTNISAQDIKNNPEGYYGQTVDYTSANGQNDWKIFHSDGTNIYLITGNCVKVTDKSGNIDEQKLNSSFTCMKKFNTTTNYRVRWVNENPNFFTVSSEVISKFKIYTYVFNINSHSIAPNARRVSTLLLTSIWGNYIDYSKGSGQYSIGGPTLQLWMDSWNARYPEQKIYCDRANDNGYFVRKCSDSISSSYGNLNLNNDKENNGGELYFSSLTDNSESIQSYWLASTSAGGDDYIYIIRYNSIFGIRYNDDAIGLRPVVCLNSNISLKQ